MNKIALLTCGDFSGFGTHDDHLFIEELKKKDIIADELVWDKEHDFDSYDLVMVRTTWDYSLKRENFIQKLHLINQKNKLYNPFDLIKWNMDKVYLKELEGKGIKILPTLWKSQNEEISFYELKDHFKEDYFILKPSIGAGSLGLTTVKSEDDLRTLPKILSVAPYILCQPFIPEVMEGEKSFIFFGGIYSHGVLKIPQNGDIRVQEEFGSKVVATNITKPELLICHEILEALPLKPLYARLDFLTIKGEIYLIEAELIEPHLYFSWSEQGALTFASAVQELLNKS